LKKIDFDTVPLDELWKLHEDIIATLTVKMETQKFEIERQLEELGRRFGGSPRDIPQPRPYPLVTPKFRNPDSPSETWSGRGKQPRWVAALLARGSSLDDFRIQ
jgi:DNA-binding protein H-NS